MAAASSGSKAIANSASWVDVNCDATGTASFFRVYNSQATKNETTCFLQGDVGTSGSDMNLSSTSITSGQQLSITSFTLTDGNA